MGGWEGHQLQVHIVQSAQIFHLLYVWLPQRDTKTIRILRFIFWVTLKAVYCTMRCKGAQQHSSGLVLDLRVHTECRLPISGVHPIPSLPMYVLGPCRSTFLFHLNIWFSCKNVFPFPLSIGQITGDFFNNRQCTPNRVHLSYNVYCLMALE